MTTNCNVEVFNDIDEQYKRRVINYIILAFCSLTEVPYTVQDFPPDVKVIYELVLNQFGSLYFVNSENHNKSTMINLAVREILNIHILSYKKF